MLINTPLVAITSSPLISLEEKLPDASRNTNVLALLAVLPVVLALAIVPLEILDALMSVKPAPLPDIEVNVPTLAAKEILGEPAHGGAINHDLVSAWYSALAVPRHKAFARSQHYGWQYAALMFLRHLVPKRAHLGFHKHGNATTIVTKLSSKY